MPISLFCVTSNEIYIAPSGVQKERIQPEDMFVCDINEQDISGPLPCKNLKKSQCTPLFMNAYTMRGQGTSKIPDPRALQTVLPFGLGHWDWRRN